VSCVGESVVVQHAQRADGQPVTRVQRHPRVEAQPVAHQRVVGEAWIFPRVGNDQHLVVRDGVRAERDVARGVIGERPEHRLEPLVFTVDE
jgi:hypothetical protein